MTSTLPGITRAGTATLPLRPFAFAICLAVAVLFAPAGLCAEELAKRDTRSPGLREAMREADATEQIPISVVLREPATAYPSIDHTDRRSQAARSEHAAWRRSRILERREAIDARRSRVLSELPKGRFATRWRYREVSGFSGWALPDAIAILAADPEVVSVDLDREIRGALAHGVSLIGGDVVHGMGYSGEGVVVAVLDTGVDTDHPDLADDLIAEACFCDDDSLPDSGCCPNGDQLQTGAGAAEDDYGHGTGVTGVITSDNASDGGLAPGAEIVAVKVLDSNAMGKRSDLTAGLDWVLSDGVPLGVRVVNMSISDGSENDDSSLAPCSGSNAANAIALLKSAGVVLFASSGNEAHDAGISFPACSPDVISVGGVYDANFGRVEWCGTTCICTDATTAADQFVCHSNSGTLLDILAPNWKTRTTWVGGGSVDFGGTSISSPYAAAQAALLIEANDTLMPNDIATALVGSGPLVANPANGLSFPRADVEEAMMAVPEPRSAPLLLVGTAFLWFAARRRSG